MNILVVNYRDRLHPAAGGAEKHLHQIFSLIAKAGHQVVLFTTSFKGAKEREVVDGIQVVRKGGDLMFQLNCALNLGKLDREFGFDVVVEDLNKLPVFSHFFVKKPVLVQMHHLWRGSIFHEAFFPVAFGVWFFERIIPLFYRKQDFVVVSSSTKRELSEIGIDEDRIAVIYNGSDDCGADSESEKPVKCPSGIPYFLWLSRVHKYKGIWTALEAFEEFAKQHSDVKLMVAGDGPLLKKIPAWLKLHNLSDRVELLGFVSRERKRELLAGAVALLQTSYKEGWGLTVVEAAKLGTTTIASDVPGLRDSVRNGETGLLFQAGDAVACASEMDRLYCNDDLRTRLEEAARAYVDEFRWETAAELTTNLLQDLVIEHQVSAVAEDE
ncbi:MULTISPECIES: glycosyltransferase family 4 protein [unclassified Fibrobacter]|uniref:glycosyltransferase family 4 protein n=1 Tax=unclassified Fibrobacter TaxID=2634177 RepID=UPI000D6CE4FA|nr:MULTISPECIES: glycosyltransferase family 4 protein [unclassified Fibrobacter]PWJ69123.1 glycosyltransferase involved in cell wall biosynthesis [Fibrobacter sp. UWR4]PZW72954.1 glycosyltransferase involved in cell wall biosynthesis [Fibrobacter sp. UWR1]